jgi:hypothetical protein
MAGCLFYELFTTSAQYSAAACEVALKEQFLRLETPPAKPKATLGSLIGWAIARGIIPAEQAQSLNHWRLMRNTIAHGHYMIVHPSWTLSTLQRVTVVLNVLFPDPDTSAYDEEARRRREEQAQEWWREIEGMVQPWPPSADDEANEDGVDDSGEAP